MNLLYLANIRMPTEKAHGLQITQMCEAFAADSAVSSLTLVVPRRRNTPEMSRITDVWAYYGVDRNFNLQYLPCIDLFRLLSRYEPAAFAIQTLTFLMALSWSLWTSQAKAEIYYSRDLFIILLLSFLRPKRSLVYEAHQLSKSGIGQRLQSLCVRRAGLIVAVTGRLADDLRARGAQQVLVAHDGIRAERFAKLPDQAAARAERKLPATAFIVGYVGQLHTMAMSKGIDILIDAIAQVPDVPVHLALVGGPEAMVNALRDKWLALGLDTSRFLFLGRVAPASVPACLATFDVCTMPFPWTDHFAYYASPLKLFEYMASGRAIVGSHLPAVAEVVHDGETALLFPPGDVAALAMALRRLYEDVSLRERLGAAARSEVAHYAWDARARLILQRLPN